MAGAKGRSGRPPKPTALHILDGTFRKDRHANRIDASPRSPEEGKMPDPPPGLRLKEQRIWRELQGVLLFRIFSREDIRALKTMVSMLARWEEVDEYIAKNGISAESEIPVKGGGSRVVVKMSPEATMWSDLNAKLLHYYARFGMTPSDRAKVREVKRGTNDQENPDDEFSTKGA